MTELEVLQQQLRYARRALEKIQNGEEPPSFAKTAISHIWSPQSEPEKYLGVTQWSDRDDGEWFGVRWINDHRPAAGTKLYGTPQLPVLVPSPEVPPVRMFNMMHGPKIPWHIAEFIYAGYSVRSRDQSLERIHERGGFSWAEVENINKDPDAIQAMRKAEKLYYQSKA